MNYAHFRPLEASYGPLGRLLLQDSPIDSDFGQIDICFDLMENEEIDLSHFILESKLALISWLEHLANKQEISDFWQRLNFIEHGSCESISNPQKVDINFTLVENSDESKLIYKSAQFLCNKSKLLKDKKEATTNYHCEALEVISLGHGTPGGLLISSPRSDPNKWIKVKSHQPAHASFNPNIKWWTLDRALLYNVNYKNHKKLVQEYKSLLETPSPTYENLLRFTKKLSKAKLIANAPNALSQILRDFRDHPEDEQRGTYRPNHVLYASLLHEVGHQLGMAHAHAPIKNDVTGFSDSTTKSNDGHWRTSEAVMAYGEPYLYLTIDDITGVQALYDAIASEIISHL